jgi:hypothetical protein
MGFDVDPFAVIEGDAGLTQDLLDVIGARPEASEEVAEDAPAPDEAS